MTSSSKRFVLITGANSGIGFAAAKLLLATSSRYHILLGSRDETKGTKAVKELQSLPGTIGSVSAIEIDVTSDSSIVAAASLIRDNFGRLESLINNAGIFPVVATDGIVRPALLRNVLETNLIGSIAVTEAFLPLLRLSSNPQLVFVTTSLASMAMASDLSLHQYRPAWAETQVPEYRISKAAVNMAMIEYMKALDLQAGQDSLPNFRVWAVGPGLNRTGLMRDLGEWYKERLGKLPDPEQNGGRVSADVVEGKRDDDIGRFIHIDGIRPW